MGREDGYKPSSEDLTLANERLKINTGSDFKIPYTAPESPYPPSEGEISVPETEGSETTSDTEDSDRIESHEALDESENMSNGKNFLGRLKGSLEDFSEKHPKTSMAVVGAIGMVAFAAVQKNPGEALAMEAAVAIALPAVAMGVYSALKTAETAFEDGRKQLVRDAHEYNTREAYKRNRAEIDQIIKERRGE